MSYLEGIMEQCLRETSEHLSQFIPAKPVKSNLSQMSMSSYNAIMTKIYRDSINDIFHKHIRQVLNDNKEEFTKLVAYRLYNSYFCYNKDSLHNWFLAEKLIRILKDKISNMKIT